jgi:hypothetical protein
MLARLSPRVRLGVMMSVIAVIVCALVRTSGRSERDHQPEAVATPTIAPTSPSTATPPSSYTQVHRLPQVVIDSLGLKSSASSSESSAGTASSGTSQSAAVDPDAFSRLVAQDAYGELVLAERGIALTWPGCLDCTAPHLPQIPFGPVYTRAGGGGSAGGAESAGGAGLLADATPPNGLTEFGNPSLDAIRQSYGEGAIPHGNAPWDPSRDVPRDRPSPDDHPVHPISPKVPPTVPVPEPSTVSLLAAAVFALTAWGRRARMHRN